MADDAPVPSFLTKVRKGSLCSGCGGCAALAPGIDMQMSSHGYLRPVITAPVDAQTDRAIADICPGLGQTVDAADRTDDLIFGPYVDMKTGWSTDTDIRFAASSGGALTAVLSHLLETGKVDGVVQTMADPDNVTGNITTVSRTRADVLAAAGSRYAPSAPVAALGDLPRGRFAVVGKPCDAAALRAMRDADPILADKIPFILSFFCAGVPSIEGGRDVVRALGFDPENTAQFRYRGMGWPGRATAETKDGKTASMTYAESWGAMLSPKVQHRCRICADGAGAAADLVCADAWETDDKGYPLFEEVDGISLIVARTHVGATLMEDAETAGHLETASFDITTLPRMQRGQTWRRRGLWMRLLALRLSGRPVPHYKGLNVRSVMTLSPWSERVKTLLGTLRRIKAGRGDETG